MHIMWSYRCDSTWRSYRSELT